MLTFFVNGREIFFPFLKNKAWDLFTLQRAVNEFDTRNICPGMLDLSLYTQRNARKKCFGKGSWHSFKCKSFCNKDEKQCVSCRVDEGKLKYLKVSQSLTTASLKKRLKANQRRVQRFIHYRKVIKKLVNWIFKILNFL